MPDLMTHSLVAYLFVRHNHFERFRIFFYLGSIFPDIFSRPFYILMPKLYFYTVSIHTPAFIAVTGLIFIEFFKPEIRSMVRNYLFSGIGLHFFLDMLQKHQQDGYYWFFPFSWKSFEIPLLWPEEFLQLLPALLILVLMVEIFYQLYRVYNNHKSK